MSAMLCIYKHLLHLGNQLSLTYKLGFKETIPHCMEDHDSFRIFLPILDDITCVL